MSILAFTDGSGPSPDRRTCSCAIIITDLNHNTIYSEIFQPDPEVIKTNNAAELYAILKCLDHKPKIIHSDSLLSINLITGAYRCHKHHLQVLVDQIRLHPHYNNVSEFKWIKGHKTTTIEEKLISECDQLCRNANKSDLLTTNLSS